MKRQIKHAIVSLLIAVIAGSGMLAGAQRPYRVSDRQMQTLLNRIETRSDRFRQSLSVALDRSNLDNTQREEFLNRFVVDFEQATNRLRDEFRNRDASAANVQAVLDRAAYLDSFMRRYRLRATAERDWNLLRSDLNLLARYYNVAVRWNDSAYRWTGNATAQRLTGTYRLDEARSENVRLTVERATAGLPASQRERTQRVMVRRLRSPEMLAIDRRGQTVNVASTLGPQLTITADGRSRYENNARVSATFYGDQLVVNMEGNRDQDYSVTFDPLTFGNQLRVTRRITVNQLAQPVVITSIYNKSSDVAQLNLYDERSARRQPNYNSSFHVPNGTRLVAVLNTGLATERTRDGDRFTMTVRTPSAYEGAVLEGYVSGVDRAGPFTGRADMTLNFERIHLRNGPSHDFAANIVSVRTPGGDSVRIDEYTVEEEDSQTKQTVTRTGIGAALGALIGAIAGGGKGAAIGAAVGAGAGAGSVFITDRDDLELPSGTEFVLDASAPATTYTRR
jgi:hypothetical protein